VIRTWSIPVVSAVALAASCAGGGMARGGVPRAPAPTLPVAVMTFNIRYGTAADGPDAWPERRELLFEVIREAAPDVMGLQEALRGQLDELHAALPGYGEGGVGRDDGRTAGEYAAILFRTDRFTFAQAGNFWFSDTPEVPGSRSWGNTVPRICTWVRLADRASGRALYAFNVHLDHESQPSRERSVALLLERIRRLARGAPVIVTGDFNAGEDNPAVEALRDSGLVDTYRALHPSDSAVNTYHAFRGTTDGPRIDFVFASPGWRPLEAAIVRTSRAGRYPSDHFPVTARLAWPERQPGGAAR
jgi:endonuclease/exonuclease/phosphatase family metal-dependent hydrolase